MNVQNLSYVRGAGWSAPLPIDLDGPHTLVIVFGAPDIADDVELRGALRQIRKTFRNSVIAGCSTAGEIHQARIRDESLSVAIAVLPHTRLAAATAPCAGSSFVPGESIARTLAAADLRGVLVFSSGLGVNGSELVRGINSVLPETVVVTGGLAGDGARFQRTWVLDRGVPTEHVVTAVGLYGDAIRVSHGSRGGWDIFGPERRVTRAESNVLYEIDGKPALDLYKRYLGDQAAGLPSTALLFPLALRESADDKKTLVRTILSVDEGASSMTFAGDIPNGSLVQLMHANFDRLIDGAGNAASAMGAPPTRAAESLTIAVSCVGRRLVLGERAEEEIDAALANLEGTTLVGFYSYGEISPYATGRCDLHNQTMTLTRLWEAA